MNWPLCNASRRVRLLAMLLAMAACTAAWGLRYDTHVAPSGARVLIVRDCGGIAGSIPQFRAEDASKPCRIGELHFVAHGQQEDGTFYEGDEVLLEQWLTQAERAHQPFQEVWLFSGGGHVAAGVGIAHSLREHRMTVRVPAGYRCVSACTIAFMGGLFRYVDEGGRYEVHSASRWASPTKSQQQELQAVARDPEHLLPELAEEIRTSSRFGAIQLFHVYENTLLLMTRHSQLNEDEDKFSEWAEANLPPMPYAQRGNRQLQADVARVKSEGAGALQDICMRLEREETLKAIPAIRETLPQDLPRAEAALQMIRSMYQTSIMETSLMSRETMLKQGYLTAEFDKP